MTTKFTDNLGVTIRATDRVIVSSWGYGARLVDTGIKSDIVRFGKTRVVILDADNRERAVSPLNLTVLRRDGSNGLEGNKPKTFVCPVCDSDVRISEPFAFGGADKLRTSLSCGHVVSRTAVAGL